MKPVTQTKRGGPDVPPEERGDCLDACLASLLEVDIEDVPCPHIPDWWEAVQDTLARHGYRLLYLGGAGRPASELVEWIGPGHWIAGVPSLNLGTHDNGRPVGHVIVMRGGDVVHDPSLGERYPLGPLSDDVPILDAMVLVELEPRAVAA